MSAAGLLGPNLVQFKKYFILKYWLVTPALKSPSLQVQHPEFGHRLQPLQPIQSVVVEVEHGQVPGWQFNYPLEKSPKIPLKKPLGSI